MAEGNAPISLPHDVVFDVLSWLPVKPLCRFLCVSTEWRALISGPAFVAVHKSRAEPLLLAYSFRFQESTLRLIDMDGNVVRVIADELGPLSKYSISTRVDDHACVAIGYFTAKVIDLATGEVLAAFHGARGTLGFGRAVPSGAYKVVSLGNTEVFTLGDRVGWRKKPETSPYPYYTCNDSSSVVNGMWYLFVQQQGYTQEDTVLRFDLESEEWRKEIQGPPKNNHFWYNITLGELNGSLCVAKSESDSRDRDRWIVWLLADDFDKSIWVKAYVIPLDASMYSQLTPLRVLPDGEKLLFSCSRPRGRGSAPAPLLRIYDPRRGACTNVLKMPPYCAWNISLCNLNLERFINVKI